MLRPVQDSNGSMEERDKYYAEIKRFETYDSGRAKYQVRKILSLLDQRPEGSILRYYARWSFPQKLNLYYLG